jgi:hypothetical protein
MKQGLPAKKTGAAGNKKGQINALFVKFVPPETKRALWPL